MPPHLILGPSHLHAEQLVNTETCGLDDYVVHAYPGLPNWCAIVLEEFEWADARGMQVIWMVSDWRFGNAYIPPTNQSLFRRRAKIGILNIEGKNINKTNDASLIGLSLQAIDYLVARYPCTRLVFWCLCVRTLLGSSYPLSSQYYACIKRYEKYSVDVLRGLSGSSFLFTLRDTSGHMKQEGLVQLTTVIESGIFVERGTCHAFWSKQARQLSIYLFVLMKRFLQKTATTSLYRLVILIVTTVQNFRCSLAIQKDSLTFMT